MPTTNKRILPCGLALAACLALQVPLAAHGGGYFGGSYKGPGDTVPPGGGGGGPGGPVLGPATPGPQGPTSPGGGGVGPAASGSGRSALTPGGPNGPQVDLTVWQYWWMFNKAPYLNLKAHVYSGVVVTGSEGFFLGRGTSDQVRDTLRPSRELIQQRVAPVLLKALEKEHSDDILSSALVALAKIGDAPDSPGSYAAAIKPFLAHPSQEVAETAAVALGILANEANTELLIDVLRDDSARLRDPHGLDVQSALPMSSRAFAAYGLGLVGSRTQSVDTRQRIVTALVELLDGEGRSLGTRDIQVGCLTSLGLTPLPIDPQADVALDGKRPESLVSRQDQLRWLAAYYADEGNNFLLRAQAPTAMARLLEGVDGPLREAVATRLLADLGPHSKKQAEIQQSCVLALGGIGDSDEDAVDVRIRETLMTMREVAADQQTRNFALICAAQVAGRPGSGAGDPIAGARDPDRKGNVRAFLGEQLAKGKQDVRPWAALSIAVLERSLDDAKQPSSTDMKASLRAVLAEAVSPDEVGGYAIAVGIARDPQAQEVLLEKLERTSDAEARGYVAVALGMIGARAAIAPIQALVKKSRYQTQLLEAGAIALGLLGDKQLVPELVGMLENAMSLSAQAAISTGLGHIGDARSIDPLLTMFQNEEQTALARAFACVALGIVADKEDLPWNSRISVDINYRANTPTLVSPGTGRGVLDIL